MTDNPDLDRIARTREVQQARRQALDQEDADLERDGGAEREIPALETALVDEIKANFAAVTDIERDQRLRELEDLQFAAGDQWLPEHTKARAAQTTPDGHTIPARPCLTVNLLDQPIEQIITEARDAHLGLKVTPKAGVTTTPLSEVMNGLVRAIQVGSGAAESRLWALDRAVKSGRGNYRVSVTFASDRDTSPEAMFDLDIVVERILNQGTVYWDPFATTADYADAAWCLVTDWISEAEHARRYPDKARLLTGGGEAFSDDLADHREWIEPASDARTTRRYRIAEYFKVTYTPEVWGYHPEVGAMRLDQMPEAVQQAVTAGAEGTRRRTLNRRAVTWSVVDGLQVLEQHAWNGDFIPIIFLPGKEQHVNGQRLWLSAIANAKDAQRGYNVMRSYQIEATGLVPRAPYLMYAGQDENFETMWDEANTRNYTRLYVNPIIDGATGQLLPLPQRQFGEPAIQALMALGQQAKEDVKATTGRFDASLGALNPNERSGVAIQRLQSQAVAGTANFVANLVTVAMQHEGRVLLDLIPKIYDRPGRIIRLLGMDDGDERSVMIKQPFVRNADGVPEPAPCPTCQGEGAIARSPLQPPVPCPTCQGTGEMPPPRPGEALPEGVEYVDLRQGEFQLVPTVGRSQATERDATLQHMAQLADAAPGLVPMYADLWARAMGNDQIADRLKANNPAATGDDDDAPRLSEVMQAFEALKTQHAAVLAQLEQAQTIIRMEQVKAEHQRMTKQMELASRENLENLKAQAKLFDRHLDTRGDLRLEGLRGEIKQLLQEMQQSHERHLQGLDHRHAATMADQAAAAQGDDGATA